MTDTHLLAWLERETQSDGLSDRDRKKGKEGIHLIEEREIKE